MLSSISKATYGAARSPMMINASRYQAAIQYSYYRGVSSSDLLHRSASSVIGGSNNYYHHQYYNYSSKQRQSSQRFFVDIALFSSALYGAAAAAAATNETPALCSNNNNSNDDDEDFISKVKAKINSQSIAELTSSLPTSLPANMNMDELLSTIGSQAQLALNSGIPTNLSYGFFAGYLSGFALKKIGRAASLTFGVGFVILQTLAYQGYVDVNHDKLAKQIEGVLDRNGDGVVDGEDLKSVVDELRRVVGFGIEAGKEEGEGEDGRNDDQVKAIAGGGGFGMGFLGGLRSG